MIEEGPSAVQLTFTILMRFILDGNGVVSTRKDRSSVRLRLLMQEKRYLMPNGELPMIPHLSCP